LIKVTESGILNHDIKGISNCVTVRPGLFAV